MTTQSQTWKMLDTCSQPRECDRPWLAWMEVNTIFCQHITKRADSNKWQKTRKRRQFSQILNKEVIKYVLCWRHGFPYINHRELINKDIVLVLCIIYWCILISNISVILCWLFQLIRNTTLSSLSSASGFEIVGLTCTDISIIWNCHSNLKLVQMLNFLSSIVYREYVESPPICYKTISYLVIIKNNPAVHVGHII